MDVRIVTVDDAVALRALRLRALHEEPEAFGSTWEEENARPLAQTIARLQSSEATFGGFDDMGRLVGMVRLRREDGVRSQHKADIISMYVAPEARGHGLGRMLLDAAIARARETPGIEQLRLSVVVVNATARNLYLAAGFEPFAREPLALKVGDRYLDEEHMALFLT